MEYVTIDENEKEPLEAADMTLLDYLAAHVMTGIRSNPNIKLNSNRMGEYNDAANEAYEIASKMIVVREKYIKK